MKLDPISPQELANIFKKPLCIAKPKPGYVIIVNPDGSITYRLAKITPSA